MPNNAPRDEPRVISEWSIDTLYVHLSRIVEDLDKRQTLDLNGKFQLLNTALLAVEKSASAALAASSAATVKAENAMEKRFEGVNEFRGAMGDQAARFITRAEVDSRMVASEKETAGVVSRLDRMESAHDSRVSVEKSQKDNTGLWLAMGAMVAAFLAAAIAGVGLFIAMYHKA